MPVAAGAGGRIGSERTRGLCDRRRRGSIAASAEICGQKQRFLPILQASTYGCMQGQFRSRQSVASLVLSLTHALPINSPSASSALKTISLHIAFSKARIKVRTTHSLLVCTV
jgi:hypothetical protein